MGQYWKPVNLDKKEFIDPHKLGAGLKLWEQVANHPGTGAALILLCADPRSLEEGSGDVKGSVVGRWARDRIVLVGDYGDSETYEECDEGGKYKDISEEVCKEIEKHLSGHFVGDGWRKFVRNTKE